MRVFNFIYNNLINTGLFGAIVYAVYQYVAEQKRNATFKSYNNIKSWAFERAKYYLKQPDATQTKVIDTVIDDLKIAQKKWFWHSFSDSTIGAIARTTVQALIDDPDFVDTINQRLDIQASNAVNNNQSSASNYVQSSQRSQAPAPANLGVMVAKTQHK